MLEVKERAHASQIQHEPIELQAYEDSLRRAVTVTTRFPVSSPASLHSSPFHVWPLSFLHTWPARMCFDILLLPLDPPRTHAAGICGRHWSTSSC